jgi:hypothetical protein
VRQRLKADKERSHDRFYNRRKFHGPELPREPARCSRNWLVRLTFSSPASTLWGNEQKLRSHWCNKIALPPGLMFSSPASTLWGNEQKLRSHWCSKIALPPHHRLNLPRRQSSLPNCGAWLAHLPLTKGALGSPCRPHRTLANGRTLARVSVVGAGLLVRTRPLETIERWNDRTCTNG